MNKIILVSHGEMASGTKKAVEMIIGKVDNLTDICLSEDTDIEIFKSQLEAESKELSKDDQLIIVADLLGGSPFISTLEILDQNSILEDAFIITGLNLYLVINICLEEENLNKNKLDNIIDESKTYIKIFEPSNEVIEDL